MAEKSKNLRMDLYGPDDAVDIGGLSVNFKLVDEEAGRMREVATTLAQQSGALEAELAKRPQKPAQYTVGRLAALDGNGNLMDSGKGTGDLAVAGHTHTAAQVSGLPTSLPANGGVAARLGQSGNVGTPMTFSWSGQSGQPSWLWGGNDGNTMYVYNPSGFNVNHANSAGNADTLDGVHANGFANAAQGQKADNALARSGGDMYGRLTAGGNQAEWEAQVRNVIIYGAGTNPAAIPVPPAGTLVTIKK